MLQEFPHKLLTLLMTAVVKRTVLIRLLTRIRSKAVFTKRKKMNLSWVKCQRRK